mgnify:CR=1 FL=1
MPEIWFPNLGIEIAHLDRVAFTVFGRNVYWYGIFIGLAVVLGVLMAMKEAKRTGQSPDMYVDFIIYALIFAIIGARLYYVIFEWDYYKNNVLQIFNLRAGGLAIYGGVIAGTITMIVYTRMKKVSFFSMADTGVLGLVTGQIIGRWGNFFNCEAFGGYTDSLLAMRIRRALVNDNMLNADVLNHRIVENGVEYIQVHPTFFYESCWNLCLLLFMLWFRRYKKYDGQMLWIYLLGYGIGRFWIESLRTDQLILFGTGLPVSQALSLVLILVAAGNLIWRGYQHRQKT